MNRTVILDKVKRCLVSRCLLSLDDMEISSLEDGYFVATANRLLRAWQKFNLGKISKLDFEISVRDFCLVFTISELEIPGYELSSVPNPLGLEQNGGCIQLFSCGDHGIENEFLESVYMRGRREDDRLCEDYYLKTNAFIRDLTGFDVFKSQAQKMAVSGALRCPEGYTQLICLPTSGGKSLITQCVAYQNPESLTVVVVPTISLMIDQVRSARNSIRMGSKNQIQHYSSNDYLGKVLDAISSRSLRILFTSPEALLKNGALRECLEEAAQAGYLQNLVVDEAHIVIEWGALFRTDYQCLNIIKRSWRSLNPRFRTFLMSATLSDDTVSHLKQMFSEGDDWMEIRCDQLRREIRYNFIRCENMARKNERLKDLILNLPHPMIVYVQNPDEADALEKRMRENGIRNIETFTGKTSASKREKLVKEWASDEFPIMIATCAFGVGVDKKDVRTVLHAYVPENPDKYYQEAGRGGRDGLPSLSVILYNRIDLDNSFGLVEKPLLPKTFIGRWLSLRNSLKTIYFDDGTIEINSTVKPDYNITGEFYEVANEQDINWNNYVLLVLRKGEALDILDVRYDGTNPLFRVKVLDQSFFANLNEYPESPLVRLLAREKRKALSGYNRMVSMLRNNHHKCVGEVFAEVYPYTEPLCAGCGAHPKPEFDVGFVPPLLKKKVPPFYVSRPGRLEKDVLVISGADSERVIQRCLERCAHVAILEKRNHRDVRGMSAASFVCYREEWDELGSRFPSMFEETCVVDLVNCNETEMLMALDDADDRRGEYTRYIFVAREDVFLEKRKRKLSEHYENETVPAEIFLRRLENV